MLSQLSQPRVLAAVPAFGLSLTFRLPQQASPAGAMRRLRDGFDPDWGVVALGEPLVLALGADVPGLRTFTAMSGPACSVPSTQQALWIRLCADERSVLFDRAARVRKLIDDTFALHESLDTFRYRTAHDLTGYEDGTENPDPQESVNVALVADADARMAGSSFLAVQRWHHDLQRFHSHTRDECDAMIGRRHEDNAEIEDAPPYAHVKRSAQESFSPEAFMVRRSMPWTQGIEQGLEFIAYGRSLDAFEQVMRRMVGKEDGIVDALFRFSEPRTGAYYWCPPVADGRISLAMVL